MLEPLSNFHVASSLALRHDVKEKSPQLPAPFSPLPKDLLHTIFGQLGAAGLNRLRLVSRAFASFIDQNLFHIPQLSSLFQACNIKSVDMPPLEGSYSGLPVQPTAEFAGTEIGVGPMNQVDRWTPQPLGSCKEKDLVFQKNLKAVNVVQVKAGVPNVLWTLDAEKEVDRLTFSSDNEKSFAQEHAYPLKAFYISEDALICITQGGTLIKWCLRTGSCLEARQAFILAENTLLSDALLFDRWMIATVHSDGGKKAIFACDLIDSKSLEVIDSSIKEGEYLTVKDLLITRTLFPRELAIISKFSVYRAHEHSLRLTHTGINEGLFKIIRQTDHFLVLAFGPYIENVPWYGSNVDVAFKVLDLVSGKIVNQMRVAYPCRDYRNTNTEAWVFDNTLILFDHFTKTLKCYLIPSLKQFATIEFPAFSENNSEAMDLAVVGICYQQKELIIVYKCRTEEWSQPKTLIVSQHETPVNPHHPSLNQ